MLHPRRAAASALSGTPSPSPPLHPPQPPAVSLTNEIEDLDGVVAVLILLVTAGLAEHEGGDIRREHGCVDDEQQHDPVPDRLERGVVQDRPLVDARRLQLVLG